MVIFYKRLKLKSEIEDSSFKHRKIKAEFFLPAFLPIYGVIPDIYVDTFKDNYSVYKDSISVRFNNIEIFIQFWNNENEYSFAH